MMDNLRMILNMGKGSLRQQQLRTRVRCNLIGHTGGEGHRILMVRYMMVCLSMGRRMAMANFKVEMAMNTWDTFRLIECMGKDNISTIMEMSIRGISKMVREVAMESANSFREGNLWDRIRMG